MKHKPLWVVIGIILIVAIVFALVKWDSSPAKNEAQASTSSITSAPAEPDTSSPPATVSESAENSVKTPLKSDEVATISLQGEQEGIATQQVCVGDSAVTVTVSFQYEGSGDAAVVTEIGEATAQNVAGWYSVERTATIQREAIAFNNDGQEAIVPITYEASVGSGWETYDCTVIINLHNAFP